MSSTVSNIPSESYGILMRDKFETDIDDQVEQIRRIGYIVIDSGYSKEKIDFDRMRSAYISKFDEEVLKSTNEFYLVRLALLMGSSLIYQVAFNPNVLNILRRVFLGTFSLFGSNGLVNPPNESYAQGKWHRDFNHQHFTSSILGISTLYCVDDFTSSNGATFFLPASQKSGAFPSSQYIERNAIQIEAKAGQIIVLDSMIYHSGGFNSTENPRRGINHIFCIPYFKAQPFNIYNQLKVQDNKNLFGEEIIMTDEEKSILGVLEKPHESIADYLQIRYKKNQNV